MNLTQEKRNNAPTRDPDSFPTAQLTLLALVRLAEPIALTSIFPYAYRIGLDSSNGDESNASLYAGLLIAAFALAESMTGMFWGSLSDRIGRKPVLLFGCTGTVISLLVVGFSQSFWVALSGRALGGLLNGNIGVIQTMVGEMIKLPEHEPRAYAVMPFVWSIGTIIGPSIGGCFAHPSENYPALFSPDGFFARFPYLLPNLICASMLVVAIVAGLLAIEDTHPGLQQWQEMSYAVSASVATPLLAGTGTTDCVAADARSDNYGTFNAIEVHEENRIVVGPDGQSPSPAYAPIFSRRCLMLITAMAIFCYHSMTYDTVLPMFLQDRRGDGDASALSFDGGLGLSTSQVGVILSISGLIALFVQGVIFPIAASRYGVWKLFLLVTMGHPIAYLMTPYLVVLPARFLYTGIYSALAVRNLFSIIAYPLLLILIKEAAPEPAHLGKVNGLAASVGALCRTLASPISGYLYGVGIKMHFTPLAWWASAIVAVVGALQLFFIRRQKDVVHVRDAMHFATMETLKCNHDAEVIHIIVEPRDGFSSDEEEAAHLVPYEATARST